MRTRPGRPARPAAGEVAELVERVHEVMKASVHRLGPTLAAEGVTMGQFWALHLVSSSAPASVSAIARHLGVSAPTVCGSLDQLEAGGLLRRERSTRDRRAVELSLTPRGRRVEARLWGRIAREMQAAATGIPAPDVAAAVRVFRALGERLGAEGPGPREAT